MAASRPAEALPLTPEPKRCEDMHDGQPESLSAAAVTIVQRCVQKGGREEGVARGVGVEGGVSTPAEWCRAAGHCCLMP